MAAETSSTPTITLYEWAPHGGLPSITAACLAVEAYLRFTGVQFAVQPCSASSSPGGVLPALEQDNEILPCKDTMDLAVARDLISQLTGRGLNLDRELTAAGRADVLAFSQLLQSRLEPATNYTTWVEKRGFRVFRQEAYGAALPFPLKYIVPWTMQRDVVKRLGYLDPFQVYPAAVEALSAVADKLRASPGPYLLGSSPSSVDALLFGHLAFYKHSPIAAPTLRDKVQQTPVLSEYVEHLLTQHFATSMPPPAVEGEEGGTWSGAAQGERSKPRPTPTAEEVRMWTGSQYWLGAAAAAIGSYILFSGRYLDIQVLDNGGEEEDEGEEEDVDLE